MSMDTNLVRLSGIVERVTFHNAVNGWSILKVSPFSDPQKLATVVIHQAKVFAGSTMEFWGVWTQHSKYGEQFKAERAIEKKPATSAGLEKYLGSGLIQGVGPKTATKIVKFFKDQTLEVFEERIDDLMKVPGIAERKLVVIKESWREHKAIRDVMIFLQGYGLSTLFAVKIYKTYGDTAISVVSQNPYQLAKDIYGIGFFSADRIALAMGFDRHGEPRIGAGIQHVLAASRDEGHCYLTEAQILKNTMELLELEESETIRRLLQMLVQANDIKTRSLVAEGETSPFQAYYSKSLYYDELYVAERVRQWVSQRVSIDRPRVSRWMERYLETAVMELSDEQQESVMGIAQESFSILTGGPGCGKTTTTRVLVKLFQAMHKNIVLVAPTGRAAQRMTEVIGLEAKTIHRLLEWEPRKNSFKKCEDEPLKLDVVIVDESSMLDISLAASLFKAIPTSAQVVLIGDPNQLPSVGAGNVLFDLLQSPCVHSFRLTKVFRQAEESLIIRYAHEMNRGHVSKIESPLHKPELWKERAGCLFIDSEEATQEQIHFLQKAKYAIQQTLSTGQEHIVQSANDTPFSRGRSRDSNAKQLRSWSV